MPLPRPATFDEFMRVQHIAAVNVTGADHSSWNGTYDVQPHKLTEDGLQVLGSAGWDHTILYDEQRVLRPLREMFDTAGETHDDATLLRYRQALAIVYHENLHLLAAHGTEHADAERDFQVAAVRALEEGVTEGYCDLTLDDYIDELQLDRIAPGIKNVYAGASYEKFTPAADTLAYELSGLAGVDRLELTRQLVVVNAADKWAVVTGLIADKYGLGAPHFAERRVEAEHRIRSAMWKHFGELRNLAGRDSTQIFTRSCAIGRKAAEEGRAIAGQFLTQRMSYGGVAPPGRAASGWGSRGARPYSAPRQPGTPDRSK